VGGKPLAGPIVDAGRSPAAAWLLSEDRNLYALSEEGRLLAKFPVPGRPLSFLALDPFGRALVATRLTAAPPDAAPAAGGATAAGGAAISGGAAAAPGTTTAPAAASAPGDGALLVAYTRSGTEAFRAAIPASPAYPPAFGADGRVFLAAGRSLLCLAPNGRRLWSLELPADPSAPPAADGSGRALVGLADGRLFVLSPFGELLLSLKTGSPPTALSPFGAAAYRGLPRPSGSERTAGEADPAGRSAASGAPAASSAAADAAASGASASSSAAAESVSPAPAAGAAAAQPGAPAPAAAGMPLFAAGLRDGSILLFGPGGERLGAAPAGAASAGAAPAASGAATRGAAAPAALRLGSPAAAFATDGSILYGLAESGLAFALSGSGRLLWKTETGIAAGARLQAGAGPGATGTGAAGQATSLALYGERLVAAGKGRAASLSLQGELFREARLKNAAAAPAPSPSGILFSPGEDWVLAAYRFERPLGRPLAPRVPPYGPDEVAIAEIRLYDPLASDPDGQLSIVAAIEKKLESGTIGKDESAAAAAARAIALGLFQPDLPAAELRFRGSPLPRARAALVLGRLGSPEYRAPLVEVLLRDGDPAVRAAACEALAEIALDPDGAVGRAFLQAAGSPGSPLDERAALVLVASIERMALRSGQPPGAEAVRALLALAAKPYGASLRSRASRALGRIAGTLGP